MNDPAPQPAPVAPGAGPVTDDSAPRQVFLLRSNDASQSPPFDLLSNALSREGYRLTLFREAAALFSALETDRPFAVLVDRDYADPQYDGLSVAGDSRLNEHNMPGILIAREGDMASRLAAVRAGVRHYLTTPINMDQLLNKLGHMAHEEQQEPYRILVVDDDELLLELFKLTLGRAGLTVKTLPDANDIVDEVHAFQPELIFMDVQMPGTSGPEAASVIRQIPEFDVIPIVYLSGDTELDLQLAALTVGGDDFLTKPVDTTHLVVTATARATRTRGLQQARQRLMRTAQELQSYQQQAENEQQMAQQLMNRMIFSKDLEDESMQYWHQPASRFSGDLVAAVRDGSDRLYLLHADAMGHGLPAALPLLPVSQIFYSMAKQGYTLGAIAEKMNSQLRVQIPVGNFVACSLMAVDRHNRTVEVWNGGSPDVLFVDHQGNIKCRFHSRHTALGVVSTDSFSRNTELYQWQQPGDIVLYSDGLSEASNRDGTEFRAQLEQVLSQPVAGSRYRNRLPALVDALDVHLDGAEPHDDISLVVVKCE